MSVVTYWLQFGSGTFVSGLSPTFITFMNQAGGATTPPGITEPSAKGIYRFDYDPQGPIVFIVDGATSLLTNTDRYVSGSLDVMDKNAQVLGNSASSFGSSSVDPVDVFGFLKRIREVLEGYQEYNKASATFNMYDRGHSTLLRTFPISDSTTLVTRT